MTATKSIKSAWLLVLENGQGITCTGGQVDRKVIGKILTMSSNAQLFPVGCQVYVRYASLQTGLKAARRPMQFGRE